jgi:tRNA A-37 threonylcarbamoyl transferase component Bud32
VSPRKRPRDAHNRKSQLDKTITSRDWIWGIVPPGFKRVVDGRGGLMVVREDMEPYLTIEHCTARDSPATQSLVLQGRGPLRAVELPAGDTALIRPYWHGGVFRYLTGDIFATWPPRPFRELAVAEEISRRGIPTVEVYGACVKRVGGPFYRGWLVTRQLKKGQDLWTAMRNDFIRDAGVGKLLEAVATSLRGLHQEGVYHRDLNLKNILVRREPAGVRGYIIDFDKARLFLGEVPTTLVRRNLDRLLRSARKLDPKREHFSDEHWKMFVKFYHGRNTDET